MIIAGNRSRKAIKHHQAEYKRLQDRIHAMYVDKLDGVVDTAFYEKMSNQWREEQSRCQREIDRLQIANQSYMDEGVQILELASNAQTLFESQEPRQKATAQLFAIELLLGGWRGRRNIPTTV